MVGVTTGRRNAVLARLLVELGWSVSRLVAEVNREVGRGYVSRTTGSEWVNISRVPRQPLPTVIAHVLSQARGSTVRVGELWPGVAVAARWLPADHGTRLPWNVQGTRALAHDWAESGGTVFDADRRSFMAISGTALTAPAWQYAQGVDSRAAAGELDLLTSGGSRSKISAGVVDMVKSTVDHLRRLDDTEGGGRQVLRIVHGEFRKVAGYVERGEFSNSTVASRMLGVFAELAQLAGWVAYDSERHGLAQRYFRTALQAAHSAGDRDLGAHILGCMVHHATYQNQHAEAVELASAAIKTARHAHPAVRSLVHSRSSHVFAAMGDAHTFHSEFEKSRSIWTDRSALEASPNFLYWYSEKYIDVHFAEGLQMLAFSTGVGSSELLRRARDFLSTQLSEKDREMPRDSLLHNVWLARSHVILGDMASALPLTHAAAQDLGAMEAPRIRVVLRELDRDLAARRSTDDAKNVRKLRMELQPLIAA